MKKQIAIVSTILVVALIGVFAFAACTPSYSSLVKKYEGEGYTVIGGEADEAAEAIKSASVIMAVLSLIGLSGDDINPDESTIQYALFASKGLKNGVLIISTNDDSFANGVKEKIADSEDASKYVKIKGNTVAFGTEEAIALF